MQNYKINNMKKNHGVVVNLCASKESPVVIQYISFLHHNQQQKQLHQRVILHHSLFFTVFILHCIYYSFVLNASTLKVIYTESINARHYYASLTCSHSHIFSVITDIKKFWLYTTAISTPWNIAWIKATVYIIFHLGTICYTKGILYCTF